MWKVARRPRWIAALLLALAVAGGFAALGQWQLERSVVTGAVVERETETVMPLEDVAKPQAPVAAASDGQRVTVTGSYVPGDFIVLSDRLNRGASGFWVVGHLVTGDAGLAVALGWAATEEEAAAAVDQLDAAAGAEPVTVTGRYLNSEAPQETDFEAGQLSVASVPTLLNLWTEADPAGVYGGYLVSAENEPGLDLIDSPAVVSQVDVNWLNIFYAAEWVIFAGFAIFLWYRLVKDAWERELAENAQIN